MSACEQAGDLHAWARWALVLAAVAFCIGFFDLFVLPALPAALPHLVHVGTALGLGFASWALFLGAHTIVRHRWPGPTATERGQAPTSRDAAWAGLAVGGALFSAALVLLPYWTWVVGLPAW